MRLRPAGEGWKGGGDWKDQDSRWSRSCLCSFICLGVSRFGVGPTRRDLLLRPPPLPLLVLLLLGRPPRRRFVVPVVAVRPEAGLRVVIVLGVAVALGEVVALCVAILLLVLRQNECKTMSSCRHYTGDFFLQN